MNRLLPAQPGRCARTAAIGGMIVPIVFSCMASFALASQGSAGADVVGLAAKESGSALSAMPADSSVEPGGDARRTIETPEWAEGELADCGACHERIMDESGAAVGLYASHDFFTCFDCHDDPLLAELHEGADTVKGQKVRKLKKTEVSAPNCSACHSGALLEEALANSKALTDANGTTVNPHAIPDNQSHQAITCLSCHTFHVQDADTNKAAQKMCASCHHANVYECGTCHSNE